MSTDTRGDIGVHKMDMDQVGALSLSILDDLDQVDSIDIRKKTDFYMTHPYEFAFEVLGYDKLIPHIHQPLVQRICSIPKSPLPLFSKLKTSTQTQSKSVELLPRGIFKTSIRTILKSIWEVAHNKDVRILIAMNSATNAFKTLSEIKNHFARNEKFKMYMGDMVTGTDRWRNDSIIVAGRTKNYKEGTIDAIGKDSRPTSQHYDIILLDDIADERDRDSEAARRDTRHFFEDMQDLLNPNGQMHVTGTRWHFDDVYNYILNDLNPQLREQKLISYGDTVSPVRDSKDNLNFPEMFDQAKLDQLITEKGVVSFSAQYMLSPLVEGTQLFLQDNCSFFDMQDFDMSEGEPYGYCDPALGENKQACQAPIITGFAMHSGRYKGKILITNTDIEVRPVSRTVERIVQAHMEHHYITFGIEDNGAQKLILQDVDEYAKNLSNKDRLVLVPILGVTNLTKKEMRIERFERHYSSGKVLFRKDWATAGGNYKDLMLQLWQYPAAKYRDCPDAIDSLVERVILGSTMHIGLA